MDQEWTVEWVDPHHLLSDDIYAYALSKALTRVSAPATVGLYSACQNRITRILKKVEGAFKHVRHLTWGQVAFQPRAGAALVAKTLV